MGSDPSGSRLELESVFLTKSDCLDALDAARMSARQPPERGGPVRDRRVPLREPVRVYSSTGARPECLARLRLDLAFSAIVLILVAFEAFLTSLPFADAIPDYAEQLQQRQLDSYFEMIQPLITLATVTIGGITGYVINRDNTKGLSNPQLRRVVASWALCAASLHFGYLAYQQSARMLNTGSSIPRTRASGFPHALNSGVSSPPPPPSPTSSTWSAGH